MNEFKGDKRSKAYKVWKKNHEAASNGLGDAVAKVTKATGIDKVAEFILGEDCGCETRKNALNKLFSSNKISCLTEDEHNYLSNYFDNQKPQITVDVQSRLLKIYNRVFNERASTTSCSSCFINGVHAKLKQVFEQYS